MHIRPENKRMQDFLAKHGIKADAKYLDTGSLKGRWRLSNIDTKWTVELADRLNVLGFRDFDDRCLHKYSGNGGLFSVFVKGHYEFLENPIQNQAGLESDNPFRELLS